MVGRKIVPDTATVDAVRVRLNGQAHRFVTAGRGGLAVDMAALAELIAEIATDYADHLVAERDALAEDLAWELNATHTAAAGVCGGEVR